MAFPIDQAEYVGAQIETLIYGMYLVLFPLTVYFTRKAAQSRGRPLSRIITIGGILLFLLVTAHWINDQSRLWEGFVAHQGEKNGALSFYARLSEPRSVVRSILFVSEMIVLDSLLLYRTYVIWGENWSMIIAPGLTVVGTLVSGVGIIYGFAHAPPNRDVWTLSVTKWIISYYVLSLATNIMAVVFIAYRIIRRDRALSEYGVGSLSSVIVIVVESAGIYCVVNTITLITLLARSAAHFTTLEAASPVTGISFTLISLRVGLEKTFNRWMQSMTTMTTIGGHKVRKVVEQIDVIPMHIHVTREQDVTEESKRGQPACNADSHSYSDELPDAHKAQGEHADEAWM